MIPSLSARLFAARLVFTRSIARVFRGVDASDVLTLLCLAFIFAGVAMVSISAALVVTGTLIGLVTPIGLALRVFVRGR